LFLLNISCYPVSKPYFPSSRVTMKRRLPSLLWMVPLPLLQPKATRLWGRPNTRFPYISGVWPASWNAPFRIIGIFKRPFSGDFRSCTSALFCLEFRNENPIPRLIGYPNISDDPPSAVTPPARHFPHAKFTDEIERPTLGDLQFLGNQSC
jgi:hypothetical protein